MTLRFKDIKMGNKLLLGFMVMLILMVIVSMAGYYASKIIQNKLADIVQIDMPFSAGKSSSGRKIILFLILGIVKSVVLVL